MTVQKDTASESPNFLVERDANGYIKVRWTVELGEVGSLSHKVFMDNLMKIKGTEYVRTKRYSASIEIAEHVVTVQEYLTQLKTVIEGCGDFSVQLV